jgi:hypothetical protein
MKIVQFEPNCSIWADGRKDRQADRQRDRHYEANSVFFRNFSNASKNNCNKYEISPFNNSTYIDVELYIFIFIYHLIMF